MSKNVTIKFNYAGLGQLLKSPEIEKGMKDIAEGIAGPYRVSGVSRGKRAKAFISTTTTAEYRDNLKNNTLLKLLGGAGKVRK
jgi:hypothetical protein